MAFFGSTAYLNKTISKDLTLKKDKRSHIKKDMINLRKAILSLCFFNLLHSVSYASDISCTELLTKKKETNIMSLPKRVPQKKSDVLLKKAGELREFNQTAKNSVITDAIRILEEEAKKPGVNEEHQRKFDAEPLIAASEAGDLAAVRSILKFGKVNINQTNTKEINALQAAATKGHMHIVAFLLEQDDVNVSLNEITFDPLTAALDNNHINIFKLLLAHKTSRLVAFNYKVNNALMIALEENLIDVAYLILDQIDKGIDLNLVNSYNDTALTLSLKGGHFDFAKELILYTLATHQLFKQPQKMGR